MRSHSYKQIDYKCEECDFCGSNKFTMDVHVGKEHSENYECGLCEYVAKDLQALETHIFTCECSLCGKCDKKCTTLAALKSHMVDKQLKQVSVTIYHSKQSRTNQD